MEEKKAGNNRSVKKTHTQERIHGPHFCKWVTFFRAVYSAGRQ